MPRAFSERPEAGGGDDDGEGGMGGGVIVGVSISSWIISSRVLSDLRGQRALASGIQESVRRGVKQTNDEKNEKNEKNKKNEKNEKNEKVKSTKNQHKKINTTSLMET